VVDFYLWLMFGRWQMKNAQNFTLEFSLQAASGHALA
jgi:hypothetical protein